MDVDDSLDRISEYLKRWKLTGAHLTAQTNTSWIYQVKQKRAGFAALKLLKPGDNDERYGGDVLDWYQGNGAAKVLALSHDASLIEWLEGPSLSSLVQQGDDLGAANVVCNIIENLSAKRPHPPAHTLIPLEQRLSTLFSTNKQLWPAAARDMLIRAQIVARQLLSTTQRQIPLHGDIHHGNILYSERGWLAIDPKGLLGDPAYEFANCFINPIDLTETCAEATRIEALAQLFATHFGLEKDRILGFAVVHAAVSACWDLEAGNAIHHQLAILPRLISAHYLAVEDAR